jgi:hypothetical protein
MSFNYERDEVHKRIVITFAGAFEMGEALASIARRRAEGTWSHSVLYDIRHVVGLPDMEELRQLVREDLSIPTGGQPRGPLALVAASTSQYARACTVAVLAQFKVNIRVFRDLGEAHSWLSAAKQISPE